MFRNLYIFVLIHILRGCPKVEALLDQNPRDVSAVPQSTTSIKLSWKPALRKNERQTRYDVYQSGTFLRDTQSTETTISGLDPSTQYIFKIYATRSGYGYIQPGVFVHARTFDEASRNPSEATATALSSTSIRLSWKAPSKAANLRVNYEISWKPGGGPSLKTESRELIISQLVPNTTYVFRVHSMDVFEAVLMPGVSVTATTMAKDSAGWHFRLKASAITFVILTPTILLVVYFVFLNNNRTWGWISNEKPRIKVDERPVF
ncbi:hypothetical protein SprV_0200641100 [Sparganum proliferum]